MLLLVAFTAACSNEESSIIPTEKDNAALLRTGRTSPFWTGQIGRVMPDGSALLVVPEAQAKAELEYLLADQGMNTRLSYVTIEKKLDVNNDRDFTYALIGSDNTGLSVGVMLSANANGSLFYFDPNIGGGSGGGHVTNVACRGCGTGCNLQYVKLDGKKIFYCNENGCGDWCEKLILE